MRPVRPAPGADAPRPDARPRPRPTEADPASGPTPTEARPQPVTRTAAVHRNEIAPPERRPRVGVNGRSAVDGSAGTPAPVTGGSAQQVHTNGAAPATPGATGDGGAMSTAERSLHASTVAVRVVALAAVVPAAARGDEARPREREPEQTEAS
jgi:hypothetical protein